ncbi:MAG TPA: hypothetical protein VIA81_05125 [Acidimicrobiia bacterium]
MKGRLWAAVGLFLWLGFVGFAVIALHNLGDVYPIGAITDSGGPVEPALAAAARLIGLVVGYWLGATAILYLLVSLVRGARTVRAVGLVTFGPIRRLIDRMTAGAVVVSLTIPLAASAGTVPGYVPVPAGDSAPVPSEPAGTTTTQPAPAIVEPPSLYLPVVPFPEPEAQPASSDNRLPNHEIEVTVAAGDDMWQLAEQRLEIHLGRPATDAEIAPYWLAVIGANLHRIRSGDPDLIYPGEVLVLPPVG